MFCPKCKAEYIEGVNSCTDCNIPLVDKLQIEPTEASSKEYIKFEEIMYTYSPTDIAFIKSLFDAHNIRYNIQGEHFLQLRPLFQPVGIRVDATQVEEAKELLKSFKGRFTGLAPDKQS